MSDKVYILIPVFEAGLSTYEYVLEFIKCIKNCKAVNTDFFQPLTDVILNPSVFCDDMVLDILTTMFQRFDLLQNTSFQDALYDIFRCDTEESKTVVKQLTGFMLLRTAKHLAKKMVRSEIKDVLQNTRYMDYMYLILSMIWVPVIVECNRK